MVHYATPILTTVFWFFCVPKGAHKWTDALLWLIYPAAYLIYYVARGAADGFYAYYFIELPKIGTELFAMNTGGIMVVFVLMGLEFVALDKALGQNAAQSAGQGARSVPASVESETAPDSLLVALP